MLAVVAAVHRPTGDHRLDYKLDAGPEVVVERFDYAFLIPDERQIRSIGLACRR